MNTKKVRTVLPSQTGAPLNVYGRLTEDGIQVAVWTKFQNVGFYNIDRFPDRKLTGANLRHVLTGGKA
jgi:hypothetical protein